MRIYIGINVLLNKYLIADFLIVLSDSGRSVCLPMERDNNDRQEEAERSEIEESDLPEFGSESLNPIPGEEIEREEEESNAEENEELPGLEESEEETRVIQLRSVRIPFGSPSPRAVYELFAEVEEVAREQLHTISRELVTYSDDHLFVPETELVNQLAQTHL